MPVTFRSTLPSCIAEREAYNGYVPREREIVEMILGDVFEYLHDNKIPFIKVLRSVIREHTGVNPGLKDTKDVVDQIVALVDSLYERTESEARAASNVEDGWHQLSARQQHLLMERLGLCRKAG